MDFSVLISNNGISVLTVESSWEFVGSCSVS